MGDAKLSKVPRRYLETLIKKGLLSPDVLAAAEAAGAVTAGSGGAGIPAVTRLVETGMPEEVARALEKARVEYNSAQKASGSRWRLRFVVQETGGKED